MSSTATHQLQLAKSTQALDLNDSKNKCIVTFQVVPSDNTVPYDVAVVSQSMLDNDPQWEASSYKRFSGTLVNSVEIDDDTPQQYYLALRLAPGEETPINVNVTMDTKPSPAYVAPPPAVPQTLKVNLPGDEITVKWYQSTWGIVGILVVVAAAAYFGYRYYSSRKASTTVAFNTNRPMMPSRPAFPSTPLSRPVQQPFMRRAPVVAATKPPPTPRPAPSKAEPSIRYNKPPVADIVSPALSASSHASSSSAASSSSSSSTKSSSAASSSAASELPSPPVPDVGGNKLTSKLLAKLKK